MDRTHAHDRRIKTCRGIGCDARQRGDPALFRLICGHQQHGGGAVVQAGCVGCGHRSVAGEGGAQFLQRVQGRAVADVFILVDDDLALARLHDEIDHLVVEAASLLRGFGLVLAGQREFVLRVAADLPFFGNVFSGLAHVVAVEGIPKTVADHRIDVRDVAHLHAGAQMRHMGAEGHVFLAAGSDDRRIAQLDVLGCQRHGAQARAADLVDRPGRGFDRQAGIDMRLARGVLALARGQHLAQDGFGDFRLVDARAGDNGFEHGGPKVMCGRVCECAPERTDSGARRRGDYDIGHVYPPPI